MDVRWKRGEGERRGGEKEWCRGLKESREGEDERWERGEEEERCRGGGRGGGEN